MYVASLHLENFRSFVSLPALSLGRINVLTGHNNTGKSSIISALYLFQTSHVVANSYIRNGEQASRIDARFEEVVGVKTWGAMGECGRATASLLLQRGTASQPSIQLDFGGGANYVAPFPSQEPNHFIVPFFSRRKAFQYVEDVRRNNAIQVESNLSFLAAKLSRLSNRGFPGHDQYTEYCKKILGFPVYTVPSENGQIPGVYLDDESVISIESMGEGVANIASLLASLISSKGKLFLIEEPENDLHPGALRELLELIVKASEHNQFVVSSHSNIVVQYLAAASNSKLFNVSTKFGELPPVSIVEEILPTPAARIAALKSLGYTLADFELWEGWLILEESSAERLIRDFLIPWFFPRLSCLRTLSASGIAGVEPAFNDLHRMLKFAHLTPIYQARTWVLVDGDDAGVRTVDRLRQAFSTWNRDRFSALEQQNFEAYYPDVFGEQAKRALEIFNKDEKREAKRTLLLAVVDWLNADPVRGKKAIQVSAGEVLQHLAAIETQIFGATG
nr:AAA family ATPase [Herbaspirillum sp. ASV7]